MVLPGKVLALPETKLGSLLTVKQAEMVKQPVGTIRSVELGARNKIVYYNGAVGSKSRQMVISQEPLQYKDSTGKYSPFDLSPVKSNRAGYSTQVRMGLSVFDIDSTGKTGYTKGGEGFEVIPNAATAKIPKEVEFSTTRMKETLIVGADAPRHLGWQIRGDIEIAKRKIAPFTATDAAGNAVAVTGKWNGDSLTVDLPDGEIRLDPTIIDTIAPGTGLERSWRSEAGTWLSARNATVANAEWTGLSHFNLKVDRIPIKFPIPSDILTLDSANVTVTASLAGALKAVLVRGTFSGDTTAGWFNDILGWQASGTYADSVALLSDSVSQDGGVVFRLTASGKAAVIEERGDTLRMVALETRDYYGGPDGASSYSGWFFNTLKLYLYYSTGNPPGVSTRSDSLRPAVDLVVKVDSTGGLNATSLTIKMWPKNAGASDTTTLTKSGSFGAGELIHVYCDSLPMDSLMYWKGLLTAPGGSSWTALDSFWTTLTGGTVTVTDTLNTIQYITSPSKRPGKFQGR
jgi:hypothetical protein